MANRSSLLAAKGGKTILYWTDDIGVKSVKFTAVLADFWAFLGEFEQNIRVSN